jgi:drug/metabolite transporter (DMT)-like permease
VLLATLTLVLASAFLHAAWNALLKRSLNLEAMTLGILVVALAITGAAVPFVPGPAFPHRIALVWALGSGCCEGLYFLALSRALARASLGWSYTWMRGGSILLVWPISLLFLGESLHAASAAAVGVVCAGLVLMGLTSEKGAGRGGLGWALVVALAIAGYTLCYKVSLGLGAQAIPLFATSMAVSLPVQLLVLATRRGLTRERLVTPQWGLAMAGGILCAASFVLYLQSLSLGGAGAMATLRNTSVVFALMLSWFQGDRPTARQWAGALLVAAGAAGLAWPH